MKTKVKNRIIKEFRKQTGVPKKLGNKEAKLESAAKKQGF